MEETIHCLLLVSASALLCLPSRCRRVAAFRPVSLPFAPPFSHSTSPLPTCCSLTPRHPVTLTHARCPRSRLRCVRVTVVEWAAAVRPFLRQWLRESGIAVEHPQGKLPPSRAVRCGWSWLPPLQPPASRRTARAVGARAALRSPRRSRWQRHGSERSPRRQCGQGQRFFLLCRGGTAVRSSIPLSSSLRCHLCSPPVARFRCDATASRPSCRIAADVTVTYSCPPRPRSFCRCLGG